jgi:ATP-dependent protease ClpP protease subunit
MAMEINIFGEIGYESPTVQEIKSKIDRSQGQEIIVNISSLGGSIIDGLAISEMLSLHKGKSTTRGIGIIASAATIIMMAGKYKEMTKNSFFMIHNSWGANVGGAEDMEKTADLLKMFDEQMALIYTAQIESKDKLIDNDKNKTVAAIKKMMQAETWLTADEALEMGFIDAICEEKEDTNEVYKDAFAFVRASSNKFKNIPKQIQNSMQSEKKSFLQQIAAMFGFKAEIIEQETAENIADSVTEIEAASPNEQAIDEVKTDLEAEKLAKIEAINKEIANKQAELEAIEAKIQAKFSYKSEEKADKNVETGFTQEQILQASKFINSLFKN